MFKEYYTITNSKACVTDEKGMNIKEGGTNIERQIKLENNIEFLLNLIKESEKQLNRVKEESSKKTVIAIISGMLVMLFFSVFFPTLTLWYNGDPFVTAFFKSFVEKGPLINVGRIVPLIAFTIITPVSISTFFKYKRRAKALELEIDYLNNELHAAQTELEKLKNSIEPETTLETSEVKSLHDHDKEYKENTYRRLTRIQTLSNLRKQLTELYGTEQFDEKLRDLNFNDEEIEMGREIVKKISMQPTGEYYQK